MDSYTIVVIIFVGAVLYLYTKERETKPKKVKPIEKPIKVEKSFKEDVDTTNITSEMIEAFLNKKVLHPYNNKFFEIETERANGIRYLMLYLSGDISYHQLIAHLNGSDNGYSFTNNVLQNEKLTNKYTSKYETLKMFKQLQRGEISNHEFIKYMNKDL